MKKNNNNNVIIRTTPINNIIGGGYRVPKFNKTGFNVNQSTEGETLEEKINRIVRLNEPIKDGAPLVYTERKDGVRAEYNIRTDRFDIALDAMDKYQQSITAQRKSREKAPEDAPIQGTSDTGKSD